MEGKTVLTIEKLSYGYPEKELYEEISFQIEEGSHCALIGTSGTGKSTLIDMILHPDQYMYDGKILFDGEREPGYVSQFIKRMEAVEQVEKEVTVFEYIAERFLILEKRIEELCDEMGESEDIDEVMERYQRALDELESIGGSNYESMIHSQLSAAELMQIRDLPVSKISGGELKLITIIREMLTSPDFLVMDEPDVFLDFYNLNALKNLIQSFKGTLLVITHNRYILDHCFHKIIHLENKDIQEFEGTYLEYQYSLMEKKVELQELAIKDEEEIKRNEELIERLREKASYNAEAANGRSLHARVKIHERLVQNQIKAPFVEMKQPFIELKIDNTLSEEEMILDVKGYHVAFDDVLLDQVSFSLKGKEHVAVVGANGCGKTTLFRDLMKNQMESICFHENALAGYLSQEQGEVLNESNTVLREFLDLGIPTNSKVEELITSFELGASVLNQKIGSLSGGEKNLLQLAKMSCNQANLLLLDEPTSHLDLYSQLALEKALKEYPGAILMISHDFYLLANCMDYILFIEDQTIRKVSMRKFRQMMYKKYFEKDYLLIDQQKKELEIKITSELMKRDFEKAKEYLEQFAEIVL